MKNPPHSLIALIFTLEQFSAAGALGSGFYYLFDYTPPRYGLTTFSFASAAILLFGSFAVYKIFYHESLFPPTSKPPTKEPTSCSCQQSSSPSPAS